MEILKRIMALVLAATLLSSIALPVVATETEEKTGSKGSDVSELMNIGAVNPLTGKETPPFNSASGSPVLMSKENELLLYTSNKRGLAKNDDFAIVFEQMDDNTSYTGESNMYPGLDLFFVTAVALNASGNGTDDHIAYLGVKVFDNDDGGANAGRAGEQVLTLVLYNARKDRVVDTVELGSVKSWINNVEHYSYKTLFSVTAGDYDGDGIDEIACTDADMGVRMVEINNYGKDLSLELEMRYPWTALVSEDIAEKMKKAVTSTAECNRRVLFSLATGNFDGTGAEELAVAVSTNHPGEDDFLPDIPEAYTTQLAMLSLPMSPMFHGENIRTLVVQATEASEDEEAQDNVVHRVIYVGQITAGDVDGDRRDEIVVAGYTGKIEVTADGELVNDGYEYDEENIALCYVDIDGSWFGIPAITVDAMTPFIAEGFFTSQCLVPLSIDAAKLHGQYGKESVFVGGKVYQFSSEEATPLYTHAFFENESHYTITDAYVEHVTSGVFGGDDPLNDGKSMINEQFVFTVVEKDNSQNEYNYKVGFISMSTNLETQMTIFADNSATMENDGYLLEERPGGIKNDTDYGTALVPVAVDIDEDGMLVKHTNTTYFYEDPSVEAILQAAPHFGELGNWNEFNSSTTYSVSVSRSLIDIWGSTYSIHVGLKGKAETVVGVSEIEMKAGYALDMDFEHEKAYTTTYTTTFEAGSYDTVIVQRTPYICYEYSFVDINGNLLTGDDAGSVVYMEAMKPVYFQLSVDEYNRFVDEYNALAERHDSKGTTADGKPIESLGDSYRLVKITDDILPSNSIGNPDNYLSTIRDGEYISQGSYALGHNGGYTTSEFSYEIEETYSATFAHGFHFELEGVLGGNTLGLGGFVALSLQKTYGYGNATINGNGTGGTVANIVPSNYSESEQEALKMYGFNWRCAMWKKSLMTDASGKPFRDAGGNIIEIPVVGYVVTNVSRPMAAPTGVDAYLSGGGYQVTVDWTPSLNGAHALKGYYIYRSCDDREPVLVNNTILSPGKSSFVDSTTLKPGKIYTYYVVARYDNGSTEYSTMNPKSSSVVWGVPGSPNTIPEDTLEDTWGSGYGHAAFIFGEGSLTTVLIMLAVIVVAGSLGVIVVSKKKKASEEAENEEQ